MTRALNTVSTDDAYVNGHFTFVAARVSGQVVSVLVDDNYRVRKGDVLVRLDPQPYQIMVDAKRAAYDLAKSNLTVTHDNVRAMIATARAARFKMDHATEDVDNQIALLKANFAALQTAKAKLVLADANYKRGIALQKQPGVISEQDIDQYKSAYFVAEAQVELALQQVYQVRVSLGLPAQPKSGNLTEVPPESGPELLHGASGSGPTDAAVRGPARVLSRLRSTSRPRKLLADFYKRDPKGNIDSHPDARLAITRPPIKQAEAQAAPGPKPIWTRPS